MKSRLISRKRRLAPAVLGWLTVALIVGALAPLAVAVTADHLIISEVNWPGTRAPKGSQCIKIVNPTGTAVPMQDVYLTDATLSPGTVYYNITLATPAVANPGGTAGQDFHARFPAGYSIAAGDTVVVAVNGSDEYETEYGVLPDFELVEDGLTADAVPDLVEAFPGSITVDLSNLGTSPILDRTAESLVLYTWDGTSDLVADLDYVIWGTNENSRVDKTGVTIGSSTYLSDTAVGSQSPAATSVLAGQSLRRTDDDEGADETDGGAGNGVGGHDETGEALATTFSTATGFLGASAPAVMAASAPVYTAAETNPVTPHAGSATTVSLTLDSYSAVTGVTFYYAVDDVDQTPITGTDAGSGVWTAELAQQAEDAVVTWYAEAMNADGASALYPVSAPLYTNTYTVEGEPVAGEGAEKLLITEVNAGPNFYPSFSGMEDLASEFIEIYNPNAYEVDLSDYYLTDSISFVAGSQVYWNITQEASESSIGGGNYNDFHARFPDGFMIGSEELVVIALAGSDYFFDVYGSQPDIELYEDGASADAIPDMRPVFTNGDGGDSIYTPGRAAGSDNMPRGIPELEEFYGEPVILYQWNGASDLVTDVDLFLFGEATTGDFRQSFDKSGITVGASTYLAETAVASQAWYTSIITDPANSYTRTDLDETGQTASGSNGVAGRDETSENLGSNFASQSASPGELEGGGSSGTGGASDAAEKLLITEISCGVNFYPNFNGMEDIATEFIEIHNPNDIDVDMSDYYLTDCISYVASSQLYWQIVNGATESNIGGGHYNDFHARFPDGYILEAHDTIVISIGGSEGYYSVFALEPDLELYEDGDTADAIPDMRPVFTNGDGGDSIFTDGRTAGSDGMPRGIPELEEFYGEPVILYFWDGDTDLVTDIDIVQTGDSKTGSYRTGFSKTGVTIGTSTYADDTTVDAQRWFNDLNPDGATSYHRVENAEGDQASSGGNGVDGRDETSEDWASTFAQGSFNPGYYEFAGTGGGGGLEEQPLFQLEVAAATFIPREGEEYNFKFKISAEGFEFRLRIFDLEGRMIRTLYDNRFDDPVLPGIFKNVPWDGRNDTYELVRAGMYIAHFSVVNIETGSEETKTMPVVVASRLDK